MNDKPRESGKGYIIDLDKANSLILDKDKEIESLKEENIILKEIHEKEINRLKNKILKLKRTTRYKLGNAIILGLKPSRHTLLLPFRIIKIISQSIKRKIEDFKNNKKYIDSKYIDNINNETDPDKLKEIFDSINGKFKIKVGKRLYRIYKDMGHVSLALEVMEELEQASYNSNSSFIRREIMINEDKLKMLKKDNYLENIETIEHENMTISKESILHVLNTSIPYRKNGYGIRSLYILENQKGMGYIPSVITRPGFPNDFKKGTINEKSNLIEEYFNNIKFYRCFPNKIMRYEPMVSYTDYFSDSIVKAALKENSAIIHASSNYIIGYSALKAAKKLNRPFLYEIRGFWELSTVSKESKFRDSEEYQLAQKMETYISKMADHIAVISKGLKKELIKRGINEEKITIIPNGVDTNKFKPIKKDEKLGMKYNINKKFTLGYIGSIVKYEGLQNLIKVIDILKRKGYQNIQLIICGSGKYKKELENLTSDLQLNNEIIFTGRIEHEDVINYYSIFDLCVFPRIKEEVTNMVTPLKPLEAMACGKAIIGSDLEAMKELIINDTNGLIYDNTLDDMASKIELIYNDIDKKQKLMYQAREWVERNRSWANITLEYEHIYSEIRSEV